MRLKYEFAGTKPTKKGMVVWFEVKTGSTRRAQGLLVPWSEFSDREALDCIAGQVAQELKDRWSQANEEAQPYLPWD